MCLDCSQVLISWEFKLLVETLKQDRVKDRDKTNLEERPPLLAGGLGLVEVDGPQHLDKWMHMKLGCVIDSKHIEK